MLPKEINLGPLTFHLYGFLIGIAVFIGWYVCKKRARQYKIPDKVFEDYFLLIPALTALVCARIYHVLDYWEVYRIDPVKILYIQNGGIGIWGALIGAIVGLYLYSKLRNLKFLTVLDLVAPTLALSQAIGRIGNFVNQEGFGPPTNLPWKVYIDAVNRPLNYISQSYFHPTFFYEALLDLFTFLILLSVSKRLKRPGQVFALYLIFYAIARFIVEHWRIDTWVSGGIKVSYLFSTLSLVIGLVMFAYLTYFRRLDPVRKNILDNDVPNGVDKD